MHLILRSLKTQLFLAARMRPAIHPQTLAYSPLICAACYNTPPHSRLRRGGSGAPHDPQARSMRDNLLETGLDPGLYGGDLRITERTGGRHDRCRLIVAARCGDFFIP